MIHYIEAERAKQIAQRYIADYHPHLKSARIAFLMKEKKEGRTTTTKTGRQGKKLKLASTSTVGEKIKAAMQTNDRSGSCDFILEIDELLWDQLKLNEQEALVDHELCHMGRDQNGWYIKDHDITEFREILERHGPWLSEIREFLETKAQKEMFPPEGVESSEGHPAKITVGCSEPDCTGALQYQATKPALVDADDPLGDHDDFPCYQCLECKTIHAVDLVEEMAGEPGEPDPGLSVAFEEKVGTTE